VALIESSARKCTFIERAIASCGAENAQVVCSRAESWTVGLRRFDLVTARALAPFPVVVEYAAPLLRIGGALVVWRGRRDPESEAAAARAAALLGLELDEVRRVLPYPTAQHRYLHLMLKVMETPHGFPRRAGMALKRPLASG
jgi:16S rRNA (guanine527-N7)-methyltransferase